MKIITGSIHDDRFEIAERKGIGHPDTICDMINEEISIALCKYYIDHFGFVLHHNVDKALLIGGESKPSFLGGEIIEPMSIIVAGRAIHAVKDKIIPVEEIAEEAVKKWIATNIRHLDETKDVEISIRIRRGSPDLVELFNRFGKGEVPLANDTSFGAGYYPLTALEENIIAIENLLNHQETKTKFPFIGEDIKVMGVKDLSQNCYTISIAMVDRYINDVSDYESKIDEVKQFLSATISDDRAIFFINTADDYSKGSLFLTVTGTSAESGDDGQVGRGNRINGLITPYFPMSLEAISGKNPVSHVGKIYNQLAMDLSRAIVENNYASAARVYIVSQIGKPIDEPQILHLQLKDQQVNDSIIEDFAKSQLSDLGQFWKRFLPFVND